MASLIQQYISQIYILAQLQPRNTLHGAECNPTGSCANQSFLITYAAQSLWKLKLKIIPSSPLLSHAVFCSNHNCLIYLHSSSLGMKSHQPHACLCSLRVFSSSTFSPATNAGLGHCLYTVFKLLCVSQPLLGTSGSPGLTPELLQCDYSTIFLL